MKKIIIALFIIVLTAGCVGTPEQEAPTSVPTTIAATTASTPQPTPALYHVGETASDGITNITLNGLRYTTIIDEKNNALYISRASPGNKYAILDITLEIIKYGESRNFPQGMSFYIVDSDGYLYTNHKEEYMALKKPLASSMSLLYGDKLRGELSFEIPSDARRLRFLFNSTNHTTFKLSD